MNQVINVSVLFTNLVGSTALACSGSSAMADERRRDHFGVLRRPEAEADGVEVMSGMMPGRPDAMAIHGAPVHVLRDGCIT